MNIIQNASAILFAIGALTLFACMLLSISSRNVYADATAALVGVISVVLMALGGIGLFVVRLAT